MTVIYVRDSKSRGYLRLGVESDGKKQDFNISESEYREIGSPKTQDNLTRDSFDALFTADMRYRARLKALHILSYGDNSERMLARKLKIAGINSDIISEVVREMLSLGYINSRRQIEKLVLNEVNLHNVGPLKIIPKLVAKGYLKFEISDVIDELSARGEIDFEESKARLIESRLGTDAEDGEIKKLLYQNGYFVC
ncbi:MAG: hypothetical protein E7612_02975 [Ruminococcaceae bacterium]|nr:hypothetical protein [Oscillospiraceae bacterium]